MAKKAPHPIDQHVGARVRQRRMFIGMSQEQLGDRLGLTFQQVQKYEKGTNRISASRLWEMARILDVQVSFFFEGGEDVDGNGSGLADRPQAELASGGADSERLRLNRHFVQIQDPALRRAVVDLAKSIAISCGDPEGAS